MVDNAMGPWTVQCDRPAPAASVRHAVQRNPVLDMTAMVNTSAIERDPALPDAPTARHQPSPPNGVWDWRVPARHGDTDAATAQAARWRRVRWRLAFPDAWRDQLKQLPHYNPEYVYDEGHEYEAYWTSDPDYPLARRREYDQDGFLVSPHIWHRPCITFILEALEDLFGRTGLRLTVSEPELHFASETALDLLLLTDGGKPKTQVQPDVAVLPAAAEYAQHRVLHTDRGEAIPDMVVEVVSPTSVDRDRNDKFRLYARLGVREYLLVDLGIPEQVRQPEDLQLELFRLQDNGGYALAKTTAHGHPYKSIHSRVCDTSLRIGPPLPGTSLPIFQWYDPDRDLWRDTLSDKFAEGRMAERLTMAMTMLDWVLPEAAAARARIVRHWQQAPPPPDVLDRLRTVQATPARWRELLGIPAEHADRDIHQSTPAS